VSTAAMIIVLSAFNGIESLVHDLYSDFDPEITIASKREKRLMPVSFLFKKLNALKELNKQLVL
jgi:lipoprotein-releasing system permease protein